MTLQELLIKLHTYTKIERYLKNHRDIRKDKTKIMAFDSSLSKEEAEETLVPILTHLNPDSDDGIDNFPESYFFKIDDPVNIRMTQHTRYSTPVMHSHDFYEIFYVLEGEFQQQIDNQTFTMRSGDVCLVPPGIYHSLDVDNYSIVINILIQQQLFQNLIFDSNTSGEAFSKFFLSDPQSHSIKSFAIFKTNADLKIKQMILDLFLELINKEDYYSQIVQSEFLLLLSYLLRHYGQTAVLSQPDKKQDIIDFKIITKINNHYADISLSQLQNEFHYSTQYISLRIKKATGMSFTQYVLRQRLATASELLRTTNIKIQDIGLRVGYQNQENFTRLFKKEFNVTPSRYRKNSNTF